MPAFEFSTMELPPEEQFLAWRASYSPLVDLLEPDDVSVGFTGKQVLWDLGSLALSHVSTDGLGFASLAGHVRRDPIDHWLISVMLKGNSKTDTPSRTIEGRAGSVQIHPLGKKFEGYLTDCEMLQLFVPRDFFRGMAHVLDAAEFTTRNNGMAKLLAEYLIGLARCLPSLDRSDLPGLVTATRAMILACIAPISDHRNEAGDTINNALLERARRFVQANIRSSNIGVASLQCELGVSRSRLYRLFEPYGGVVHYIQHRRLLDAHRALADPSDTRRILDIAEERGFADGSEFSRAFKREFGYNPSDVRIAGKELPNRQLTDLKWAAPADRLGALLRRLQA
ncbi:helix-turn-helix domain-containing protein [Chelativorans sp. AA-79]|uniref:helix-turn-helix domain-containing protein n=1 Tax=Chelativorans sp. AA-79 TaxID=3028735 RepID=UPI0023F7EF3A|nr:helix-turn-helix domain-containing protein [Chelativorans sp. AA-79]WEX10759.1 helix-turn-helix domain-containing protein [Chelativorans sp. AA-79]